jgi:hypothetical protein
LPLEGHLYFIFWNISQYSRFRLYYKLLLITLGKNTHPQTISPAIHTKAA